MSSIINEYEHNLNEDEFLEAELKMGIGFHNREFITFCMASVRGLMKYNDIKTVIDFGAGTGVYSKCFYELGYRVLAIEKFKSHREYMEKYAKPVPVYSLEQWRDEVKTKVDLLFWIEVAEHMTDEEVDEVFERIDATYVCFSAPSDHHEYDEKWGHINVKEQSEWINLFKAKGYRLIEEPGGPTAWTKLFKKV